MDGGIYEEKVKGLDLITGIAQKLASSCQQYLCNTLVFGQNLYGKTRFYQRVFAQIKEHHPNTAGLMTSLPVHHHH